MKLWGPGILFLLALTTVSAQFSRITRLQMEIAELGKEYEQVRQLIGQYRQAQKLIAADLATLDDDRSNQAIDHWQLQHSKAQMRQLVQYTTSFLRKQLLLQKLIAQKNEELGEYIWQQLAVFLTQLSRQSGQKDFSARHRLDQVARLLRLSYRVPIRKRNLRFTAIRPDWQVNGSESLTGCQEKRMILGHVVEIVEVELRWFTQRRQQLHYRLGLFRLLFNLAPGQATPENRAHQQEMSDDFDALVNNIASANTVLQQARAQLRLVQIREQALLIRRQR